MSSLLVLRGAARSACGAAVGRLPVAGSSGLPLAAICSSSSSSTRRSSLRPAALLPALFRMRFLSASARLRSGAGGGGKDSGSSQKKGGEEPAPTTTARRLKINKVLGALPAVAARENIYTLPNLLTVSRLVAAPFIGYCIVHGQHAWALGLFAYAAVSDLLDGWIARRWGLGTVVGTVIDPMADKTLMTVLTVSLAVQGALPVWLAVIILGRDAGLGVAAVYYRWISLPPPKTFVRYWDFSLPSAEVRPTTISKYNTALQLALMGLTTAAPVLPLELGSVLTALQYVVATTTLWSGASYVFSKDAVRILSSSSSSSPSSSPAEEGKDSDSKKDRDKDKGAAEK